MTARTDVADEGAIGKLGITFNEMAEQISKREHELQELDRLKSDFVSSVSHELRTPLTTIKTLARVLQSDKLSAEHRAEYLETISVECDRQIDFVQSLLDLSRIESGAYKVSIVEIDVARVLVDCVENQKGNAQTRKLRISLAYPLSPLPSALSDERALRRVVSGILDNAIKYSPGETEIKVSAREHGDQIAIQISDAGCGIAAQDLPHIFEKFYRGRPMRNDDSSQAADDTSNGFDDEAYSEVPGVGLGLYLVQSLVIQIGAEIKVESAGVGETSGTKFTILLPAADSPH